MKQDTKVKAVVLDFFVFRLRSSSNGGFPFPVSPDSVGLYFWTRESDFNSSHCEAAKPQHISTSVHAKGCLIHQLFYDPSTTSSITSSHPTPSPLSSTSLLPFLFLFLTPPFINLDKMTGGRC